MCVGGGVAQEAQALGWVKKATGKPLVIGFGMRLVSGFAGSVGLQTVTRGCAGFVSSPPIQLACGMRLARSFAGSVVLQTVTRKGWSCVKAAEPIRAGEQPSADASPAPPWLLLWLLLLCLAQLDNPAVLPISGRAALKAKLSCGSGQSGGVLDSWEDDLLASQPNWQESR